MEITRDAVLNTNVNADFLFWQTGFRFV